MKVDITKEQYNLSREAASRLLKVSIRTVDRYVKSKKLSTIVVDGRIWLKKRDVEAFIHTRARPESICEVDMSTPNLSTPVDVDNIDNIEVLRQDIVDSLSTAKPGRERNNSDTFKNLFEELKQEVKEKQERLEMANYRVGQLENQVRNSIPLLEYHRENYEKQKFREEIQEQLRESTNLIKSLGQKLRYAKFSKKLYIAILLLILAIQPLWLFLLNSSG